MLISREKFDEIADRYNLTDGEAEDACNFVSDLLVAEADLTEAKYPMATSCTSRLNSAAYRVFDIGRDISADNFGEE